MKNTTADTENTGCKKVSRKGAKAQRKKTTDHINCFFKEHESSLMKKQLAKISVD